MSGVLDEPPKPGRRWFQKPKVWVGILLLALFLTLVGLNIYDLVLWL